MLKNLIFLFGFSAFVTIVWIGTTIYHNSVTSQISKSNQAKIEPIDSNFDIETLDSLDGRESLRVNLSDNLNIIEDANETLSATQSGDTGIVLPDTQDITQ